RLPGPAAPTPSADDDADLGALRRASEAAPVIALVDHILARAVASRASDVHVEPAGDRLR
ncbi:MAG: type II secretion system protein GspE, partial [Gemmatimonadetes bacterium]|nr:type II secretion system protein GspE [Gemmatimonadota bacterium]